MSLVGSQATSVSSLNQFRAAAMSSNDPYLVTGASTFLAGHGFERAVSTRLQHRRDVSEVKISRTGVQ